MNDDELDKILRSTPTPEPSPEFWTAIDQAISESGQSTGPDVSPSKVASTSIDVSQSSDNVIDIAGRTSVKSGRNYQRPLVIAASIVVLLAVGVGMTRLNREPPNVSAADTPPETTEVAQDVEPTGPPAVDIAEGFVSPEQLAELLPEGAEVILGPKFGDWNDDQVDDLATLVTLDPDGLTVVIVDGQTGSVSDLMPIAGDVAGSLVVRSDRITVTALGPSSQTITELTVNNGELQLVDVTSVGPTP